MTPTLTPFHGGVHPPEHKQQSSEAPIRAAGLPPLLRLSLAQSMGAPARPCVSVGQRVLKGQRLADADGAMSVAVHAPTSGVVRAIGPQPLAHPSGLNGPGIELEPDGDERWIELTPLDWRHADPAQVLDTLQARGVAGLGGALFPTHLKLARRGLDTLVVNGAECEPYITCDDRLMRERASGIVAGIALAAQLTEARQVLIGIEDNKPHAIAAMRAACAGSGFDVVVIPTLYPSGGAKQLIHLLTGKAVPAGRRSTEFGVQCLNVATLYTAARALEHGEPAIQRLVTLTGAVARPGNVEALLGTPADWLLAEAGRQADSDQIIMGGPMMGFALPDASAGLTQASNCLIAASPALFPPRPPAMPCIRCGDCAQVCPAELQPMDLHWFAKARQFDKARDAHLFDCIECGACSYVCPSQIPLVDYYRFAKSELWASDRDKKAAERARQRHEFRQFRLERDKTEKAERLAQRSAALASQAAASTATAADAPSADDAGKRAAIEAAMARAAARQAEQTAAKADSAASATAPSDDAKRAAIEAAMARAAARKAEQAAAQADSAAPAAAPSDDAKRAAIEAAMARAAARKAEQAAAKADSAAPAAAPSDDAKRAAIEAAMARAAARRAEQAAKAATPPNSEPQ
ncbi:electron transport complex subunit RsxC [Rivihabitans pingtungensis]|uniref:electron transport complex subunit RsxC n=1 Tax=Rivihabitans pingtungensis TaxID=1054498 RepID=UPI002352AB33|nr:electron transport complex subunit RsxC [Rivihabitans pingtungensis]MCK6436913.1 electron transport complex subunit RsxC [Rivihabitans pingtungensis]